MAYLWVALSHHGYGHLAQAAPVVAALRRRRPDLRITLHTAAPGHVLEQRYAAPFEHVDEPVDVGLAMRDALTADREASRAAYAEFHRDWERRLDDEADRLARAAPDLVLADVPYRPLAAAARAGIPSAALCSLNWLAVYREYCADAPEAPVVLEQMLAAYRSARLFLRPEPSIPMPELATNAASVGPVCRLGTRRRDEIARRVAVGPDDRLVLVALGGIPMRLPLERWSGMTRVRWLVPAEWEPQAPHAVPWEMLGMPFADALASCDAVLTKPGYGTVVEAACQGRPVLWLPRGDWPEEPAMHEWLRRNGRVREVTLDQLARGDFGDTLERLWSDPAPEPPVPTGAEEAADKLEELFPRL